MGLQESDMTEQLPTAHRQTLSLFIFFANNELAVRKSYPVGKKKKKKKTTYSGQDLLLLLLIKINIKSIMVKNITYLVLYHALDLSLYCFCCS